MLKTLDPSIVRAILEGQPDVLAAEAKAEKDFYERLACPMCYEAGGCEKRLRPPQVAINEEGEPIVLASPFSSIRALPQGYAHCVHCGTDFDPATGVISRTEATGIQPVDLDPAARIVGSPSDPPQE